MLATRGFQHSGQGLGGPQYINSRERVRAGQSPEAGSELLTAGQYETEANRTFPKNPLDMLFYRAPVEQSQGVYWQEGRSGQAARPEALVNVQQSNKEKSRTFGHELWHHAVRLGVISDKDVDELYNEAKDGRWGRGQPYESQNPDEAVATIFGDYFLAGQYPDVQISDKAKKIFEKILPEGSGSLVQRVKENQNFNQIQHVQ